MHIFTCSSRRPKLLIEKDMAFKGNIIGYISVAIKYVKIISSFNHGPLNRSKYKQLEMLLKTPYWKRI